MSRDLLLVTLSLFAWGLGEGMFIFFQSLYLEQWGANPVEIGAVLGSMGILMTVAQIPAGYLADRVGRREVMWSSWILGAASAWIMALATSMTGFVVGLLLYGLTSFVLAPMNSYITGARGRWSVGRALTTVSAVYSLGAVIGPLVGGLIADRLGLRSVYQVSAAIFLVSTAIILFARKQPLERHAEHEARGHLFQNQRFLVYLSVAAVTTFATYLPQPLASNFLQNQRGLSLAAIGQLGSLNSLGSALISLAFGRLSSGIASLIGQVLVAGFSLLLWLGSGLPAFGVGYFVLGGYRLCRSMTLALGRPLVRHAEVGLAYGAIETVNSSAFILAPLLAGLIYQRAPGLLYPISLGLGGVSILYSALFLWRSRHERRMAMEKMEAAAADSIELQPVDGSAASQS